MEGSSAEELASTDDDDLGADAEGAVAPREEAGGAWEVIGAMVETVPAEKALPSDDKEAAYRVSPLPPTIESNSHSASTE